MQKGKKKDIKKMLVKKLSTLVIEIDITKTEKNTNEIIDIIQQLESCELADNDLEIKDIYFK